MPIRNECTPTRVFGPLEQTIFLGCSVASFTTSVGWNEQVSEMTVQLVEDPCSGSKVYWDSSLNKQTASLADPGFSGVDRWLSAATGKQYSGVKANVSDTVVFAAVDIIGSPVFFRIGTFEFTGLVQSFELSNSTSGNPTYMVKLVDPRQILEGAQIILGEYAGGVGSVYNIFNPFGAMEKFGTWAQQLGLLSVPATLNKYKLTTDDGSGLTLNNDGAIFGSFPGGYGGALTTDNGIPWSILRSGMNLLISSMPRASTLGLGVFSPYGRLLFRGTNNSGYGLLSADVNNLHEYYLDITDLPTMPTSWRISGSNTSIMNIIQEVCDSAGCDYYIELVLVPSGALAPSGIAKFIKVRTAQRSTQPDLGQIPTIIGDSSYLIDSTMGRELRNEQTSSFIIGGPKNTLYQVEQTYEGDPWQDDAILPFFGLKNNGDVIIPEQNDDGDWEFEIETDGIDAQFKQAAVFTDGVITLSEFELRGALSGEDEWKDICIELNTDCGQKLDSIGAKKSWEAGAVIAAMPKGDVGPRDMVRIGPDGFPIPVNEVNKERREDVENLFNWVKGIADEYYGVKFQIRVPYGMQPIGLPTTSAAYHRRDPENWQILTSESPVQAGWSERSTILGAPNNGVTNASYVIDHFRQDDMKISSFVRFNDNTLTDQSEIDPSLYRLWDSKLFLSCATAESYVYYDASTLFSPRVVISLNSSVRKVKGNAKEMAAEWWVELAERVHAAGPRDKVKERLKKALGKVGNRNLHTKLIFPFFMPDAVVIGIQSNIMTYGPWWRAGPAGQVKVEQDDGLVPWEYGSYATMNLAGTQLATESLTNMQVGEMGTLTVPGYPLYTLGAELGAYDAGFGGGQSAIETRIATSERFSDNNFDDSPILGQLYGVNMGGVWTGLYGPNITDISVSIDNDQIQTSYTMRTYTPKFGRFAKFNANRLKTIGEFQIKAQKQLRAWFSQGTRGKAQKQRTPEQQKLVEAHRAVHKSGKRHDRHAHKLLWGIHSPHELLVGSSTPYHTGDGDYKRTLVETLNIMEFGNEEASGYGNKAFMSLDGLIRPVSMDGDGDLSPYTIKAGTPCDTSSSEGSMPPVMKKNTSDVQYDEIVDIDSLNPFENPSSKARSWLYDNSRVTSDHGHDIDMVGRGSTAPSHLSIPFADYSGTYKGDYADDYRMFALRGPMLLQGWGYDLNGRPIPNNADTESSCETGLFTDQNLECKFLDNFLRKPNTWPVGPIDLRWDRKRAVWTVPQHRMLVGTLKSDLAAFGTSRATVIVGEPLYDCDGAEMDPEGSTKPEFDAIDKVGNALSSGDKIVAYYDPQSCDYYVVECVTSGSASPQIWPFTVENSFCRPDESVLIRRKIYSCVSTALINDPEYPDAFYITNGGTDDFMGADATTDTAGHFGPSCSGADGLAVTLFCTDSGGSPNFTNRILNVEHTAKWVEFCTTTTFSLSNGRYNATANVLNHWDGLNPDKTDDEVIVSLPCPGGCDSSCAGYHPDCYATGTCGVATIETRQDSNNCPCDGTLLYNIVELNDHTLVSNTGCPDQYNKSLAPGNDFCPREFRFSSGLYIAPNADDANCIVDIELRYPIDVGSGDCLTKAKVDALTLASQPKTFGMGYGNGLKIIQRLDDPCKGQVVTYNIVENTTTCITGSPTYTKLTSVPFRYTHINFAGGLGAYGKTSPSEGSDDACTVFVQPEIEIHGDAGCIDEPDSAQQQFWHIHARDGIDYDYVDDCTIKLGASFTGTCDDVFATDCSAGGVKFNNLIAGGGLYWTQTDPCKARLGVALTGSCDDVCVTDCNDGLFFNGIIAGKGLTLQQAGDKEVRLGVYLEGATGTGECLTEGSVDGGWNSITAAKGIALKTAACGLTIGLSLPINGSNYGSITFDEDCFTVDGEGCDASIGMAGTGGNVEVVTDVYCSGSGIYYSTTTLQFNDCGLFIGTV